MIYKIYWFFSSQLGIDLRRAFRSVCGLPRYVRDLFRFRSSYVGRLVLLPCLYDWHEEGGTTNNEYFWQDLLVARMIFEAKPERHVDVGSRVDGFVAHVASFREIEVFDMRPISTSIPGVVFKQADLMLPITFPFFKGGYCDSLSCLHALEHFGLGRYGDPIDSQGYGRGIANMAQLLKPYGRFYLSTPIGQERVEFNAHRVFDPRTIIRCAEANGLQLQELTVIGADGVIRQVQPNPNTLLELTKSYYNLGIFLFNKRDH